MLCVVLLVIDENEVLEGMYVVRIIVVDAMRCDAIRCISGSCTST